MKGDIHKPGRPNGQDKTVVSRGGQGSDKTSERLQQKGGWARMGMGHTFLSLDWRGSYHAGHLATIQ